MPTEIKIGPVMNTLNFRPAEGEFIFDIPGFLSVMSQLSFTVLAETDFICFDTNSVTVKFDPFRFPVGHFAIISTRFNEILHFHLLKFSGTKDEVAGYDFITESLADLGDPEWYFQAHGALREQVIDVDALGRFRSQVGFRTRFFHRANHGFKHQIELPWFGHFASCAAGWTFDCRPVNIGILFGKFIGPVTGFALFAIHHGIVELRHMAGGLPNFRMHQYAAVQPNDIFVELGHGAPPALSNGIFQRNT